MKINMTFSKIKILLILVLASLLSFSVIVTSRNDKPLKFLKANPSKSLKDSIIAIRANRLLNAYPNHLLSIENNRVIWKDGTEMIFDDSIECKDNETLSTAADIEDQLMYDYPLGIVNEPPAKNADPGRIRNELFFKKMYGASAKEVYAQLIPVRWLPRSVNQKLMVTKINNVAQKLQAISNELDTMKTMQKYLLKPGGTYCWRKIHGTQNQSMHSFGIAMDINAKFSDYWVWQTKDTANIHYINRIPFEIVKVFEKHGFIWGGKWYHYDTMHFEYRPELNPTQDKFDKKERSDK